MTNISIGKNHTSRAHETGTGGCSKPQANAGSFARALKSGASGQPPKQQVLNTIVSSSGAAATAGKNSALPTYQSTKIMNLSDLAGKFRQLGQQIQQLTSGCGLKSVPSIAIMDMKNSNQQSDCKMRHIGNTIFVEQGLYEDWRSGNETNGFEKELYQLASKILARY